MYNEAYVTRDNKQITIRFSYKSLSEKIETKIIHCHSENESKNLFNNLKEKLNEVGKIIYQGSEYFNLAYENIRQLKLKIAATIVISKRKNYAINK